MIEGKARKWPSAQVLEIKDHSCGWTRRALLALEPGSRCWLEVEGEALLFERAADDADGSSRSMIPIGRSGAAWQRLTSQTPVIALEIEFTERPQDLGRSADKWWTAEERAALGLD